jgi:hypothetical protein
MLAISACVPKSCCNPFESYLNTLLYTWNGELPLSLKATLFGVLPHLLVHPRLILCQVF